MVDLLNDEPSLLVNWRPWDADGADGPLLLSRHGVDGRPLSVAGSMKGAALVASRPRSAAVRRPSKALRWTGSPYSSSKACISDASNHR